MNRFLNSFVKKFGAVIACCALSFAIFGSNVPCIWPVYEPKEPKGLERFKKYAK